MEFPMNLLLKRLGADVTLLIMAILWGIICACQGSYFPLVLPSLVLTAHLGAVHSYHSLLVCRFFLGTIESIFY